MPEVSDAGRIIAEGTPEQVAKMEVSHTGHLLKPLLERASNKKRHPGTAWTRTEWPGESVISTAVINKAATGHG